MAMHLLGEYRETIMGHEFFLAGRPGSRRPAVSVFWIGVFVSQFFFSPASQAGASATNQAAVVLTIEGTVELNRSGAATWQAAVTNASLAFGDSLRTGPQSRATVKLSDLSVLRLSEKTVLVFREQEQRGGSILDLRAGASYFFNRSKPSSVQFRTPLISGAIRGTEFNLSAEEAGPTRVTLLEGEVALNNAQGEIVLQSGEEGVAEPGQAPRKTAVLHAINTIQWSLYYPAVLAPEELGLSTDAQRELGDSLAAYRSGDLLGALDRFPNSRASSAPIYHAALLLSVGLVGQAEAQLPKEGSPLSGALRTLVAAVKHESLPQTTAPSTASEWLARSYYLQSRSQLPEALAAAMESAARAPRFGFAHERVAELEFSLGHREAAQASLERALELSPRNAQALTLKGFLLAAENRIAEAQAAFARAKAVDGDLANAWLGAGLCKIRQGRTEEGRQELQVAAALEPNRSDLRSYLGKAWDARHDRRHATKELRLAEQLDSNDPTPWLYSALLAHEYNRENEAIADLEKSKELNDNRSVYRSGLLLDQDQAVRGVNLAKIYQDNGMSELSVREAARGVDLDYGNYSAHLFLANSYDALRDPNKANLRYETPWFSELLVAQLLAPVGSVPLSQNVSQQEYSRLFERDRLGFFSDTEYFSRGTWVENASQYGNSGNSSFAVDEYYRSENGQRPNNDVKDFNFNARFKQQFTPDDSLFLELNTSDYRSGDVLQYYDQRAASRTVRIAETQDPNLFAGYHHEWSPGVHTLLLAGRLQDEFSLQDPNASALVTTRNGAGQIIGVSQPPEQLDYISDLVAYSAELQQIFQSESQSLVVGARYQVGDINTHSVVTRLRTVDQTISPDLTRVSGYGYYSYNFGDALQLIGGLSYDYLGYPENNEIAPVSSAETHKEQFSPKAGIRWTPFKDTTLRGAWTRSLGGVFYDTSVRLEPTQIGGFNQAFRSLIPESVAGLVPGTEFETFGVAWDQKFCTRTYLTVTAELLKSYGSRTVGTLDAFGPLLLDQPSGVRQSLDFEEKSLGVVLNQLVGDRFAFGASYHLTAATLDDDVPAVPASQSANFSLSANRTVHALLHQLDLYAVFNDKSGFFARADALWFGQSNRGYAANLPGDDFWQFNVFAGYRFPRRLAEVQLGVLNIGNQDYKLNPLDLYSDLPRSRTLYASVKFDF